MMSYWEACKTGAAVGAPIGGIAGLKYGYRSGMVGSVATGGWNAFFTIPLTTLAGGAIGTAVGGVGGCLTGMGIKYAASEYSETLTPSATPTTTETIRRYCSNARQCP